MRPHAHLHSQASSHSQDVLCKLYHSERQTLTSCQGKRQTLTGTRTQAVPGLNTRTRTRDRAPTPARAPIPAREPTPSPARASRHPRFLWTVNFDAGESGEMEKAGKCEAKGQREKGSDINGLDYIISGFYLPIFVFFSRFSVDLRRFLHLLCSFVFGQCDGVGSPPRIGR